MSIKVVTEGLLRCLEEIRSGYFNPTGLTAGLYKAAHTPAGSDTLAWYLANECDFDGYAQQVLTAWSVPVMVGVRAFMQTAPLIWTPTGSAVTNDVYGIFLFDNVAAIPFLLWAEEFAGGPFVETGPLTPVVYTPSFTLKSEY